jgi:cytochrome c oxidase cbb3-type subunit 3
MLVLTLAPACSEVTGPEREISGAKIFAQNCARCHGLDGKGLPEVAGVRDLTDPGFMSTISDERMRRSIRMGRPPTMPSFGHFSEPTLKVLTAFVRRLSEPEPAPGAPASTDPTARGSRCRRASWGWSASRRSAGASRTCPLRQVC